MSEQVKLNVSKLALIVTCIVACGSIIFQAGIMTNQLQSHIAVDEQRAKEINSRISKLEQSLSAMTTMYGDLRGDLRYCSGKLDQIEKLIQKSYGSN